MKTSRNKIQLLLLLICLLLVPACSGAPSRPNQATLEVQIDRSQQLATRMASQLQSTLLATSLQATATARAVENLLLEASAWQVVLPGNFEPTSAAWTTGEDSNEYGSSTWTIAHGRLKWEATAYRDLIWWSIPDMLPVSDFYLSVIAIPVLSPPDSMMGLAFRVTEDEDSYYLFQIDADANFSVYRLEQDSWISLVPWEPAPSYLDGGKNRLAVLGIGSQFYFFINGEKVAEMQDENLVAGTAGLAIGLNHAGDSGSWEFESFQVSAPAGSSPIITANP